MKKIFYFIASAIVALGAVACQNDIDENIDNNQQTEGYSIKVTIDEQTRIDLGEADADNKRKLTFTEGDVLVVRSGHSEGTNYLFEYAKAEGDVYTFTCETEGVNSLVGTKPHIFYLGGLHESADDLISYGIICNTAAETISGIGMYANDTCHSSTFGDENNTVTLFAHPILKFTAYEPVTFKSTNPSMFFNNNAWAKEYTTKTTGEIYLPIIESNGEIEVTVTTESGFNKTLTMAFEENKIYNLGEIKAPFKVYVLAQPKSSADDWSEINLYTWNSSTNNAWPGVNITANTTVINGYTYNYFEYPESYNNTDVNVIVNNGGTAQTKDIPLGKLDKDYYVVYSASMYEVHTEAPAAGSVEEYVAPAVKTMVYLKPNSNWTQSNAWFAAYFWSPQTWVTMTDDNKDGIYECEVPEGVTNVIFCRMNPSTNTLDWSSKWDQTVDQTLPTDGKNLFTVGNGQWNDATGTWSTK